MFIIIYELSKITNEKWHSEFIMSILIFKYMMMSFSFINASVIFQIYINKTLVRLVDIFCIIYLNDIFIYNASSEKH